MIYFNHKNEFLRLNLTKFHNDVSIKMNSNEFSS